MILAVLIVIECSLRNLHITIETSLLFVDLICSLFYFGVQVLKSFLNRLSLRFRMVLRWVIFLVVKVIEVVSDICLGKHWSARVEALMVKHALFVVLLLELEWF